MSAQLLHCLLAAPPYAESVQCRSDWFKISATREPPLNQLAIELLRPIHHSPFPSNGATGPQPFSRVVLNTRLLRASRCPAEGTDTTAASTPARSPRHVSELFRGGGGRRVARTSDTWSTGGQQRGAAERRVAGTVSRGTGRDAGHRRAAETRPRLPVQRRPTRQMSALWAGLALRATAGRDGVNCVTPCTARAGGQAERPAAAVGVGSSGVFQRRATLPESEATLSAS